MNSIKIEDVKVRTYRVPTDSPESDGTLKWESTTMVLVTVAAGGKSGIGYTYADASAAAFVAGNFRSLVTGMDAFDLEAVFMAMHRAIRNNGNCGIAYMALSAVDTALWDLKAKLLDLPLCSLLGKAADEITVYGSGGFTAYTEERLTRQLGNWADNGFQQVKMKIGRQPDKDIERIRIARDAIKPETALFVDANGAYSAKQALKLAEEFEQYNVEWYEEPVSSDNLSGLSFVRDHVPARINVAAGEYGFNLTYFRNMLENRAVDVLQADATRCGGITGFLKAARLAEAFQLPFSFHCAPSVHLHAALAIPGFFTGEYFYDHVRIEKQFFDGFREAENGKLTPDYSRPGLGLELKEKDAEKYKIN